MKKAIITIVLGTVISLVILYKSSILSALLFFLLVGAIPGTDYSVPSSIMLITIIVLLLIAVIRLTAIEAFYAFIFSRAIKQHGDRKKRFPRRRFSEV